MTDTATKAGSNVRRWLRICLRLAAILLLATFVGWTLNRIEISLNRSANPAGFGRGVIQGALMPMSLPNLLVGNDVIIYSTRNTGRYYKLGYTMGVNICGAFFFGLFFRRVSRWRRRTRLTSGTDGQDSP